MAHVSTVVHLVAAMPLTQPGQSKLMPRCLPQLLTALGACLLVPPAGEQAGHLDLAGFQVHLVSQIRSHAAEAAKPKQAGATLPAPAADGSWDLPAGANCWRADRYSGRLSGKASLPRENRSGTLRWS